MKDCFQFQLHLLYINLHFQIYQLTFIYLFFSFAYCHTLKSLALDFDLRNALWIHLGLVELNKEQRGIEELNGEKKRVWMGAPNDGVQLATCHSLQGVSCHCAGLLSHSSGLPRTYTHNHTRTAFSHRVSLWSWIKYLDPLYNPWRRWERDSHSEQKIDPKDLFLKS